MQKITGLFHSKLTSFLSSNSVRNSPATTRSTAIGVVKDMNPDTDVCTATNCCEARTNSPPFSPLKGLSTTHLCNLF